MSTLNKRVLNLMGNRFELNIIGDDSESVNNHIDAATNEIRRIEQLLTTFDENSQTNNINRNAGIKPVKVDKEVYDLIARSLKISNLTMGAFDITYDSIDKGLWNFDPNMTSLPDQFLAARMVKLINYQNVVLNQNNCTVFLKRKGMRIGFAGIGKGYAADMARELLQARGVKSGIVNAAGDLVTWGRQPNGDSWTISIADPDQTNHPFSTLAISDMAITTSGSYERFSIIDGKRYSHTINPRTGLPSSGIKSVSIISASAELTNALATPVMVMGVKVGLDLINQLKAVACIIIDDEDKIHFSHNINLKN